MSTEMKEKGALVKVVLKKYNKVCDKDTSGSASIGQSSGYYPAIIVWAIANSLTAQS
jgi:hypothetical protein